MINYTIKVLGVKTTNIDNLVNVVKQVDYSVTGKDGEVEFGLMGSMVLNPPDPTDFVPYENLTEQEVISWIENKPEILQPMKDHIKIVVDKKVEENKLQDTPLPWN